MINTAILIIGTNETMLRNSVSSISNNSGWSIISAAGTEEAIEKFHQQDFDLVVFTNGFHQDEKKLRKIFTLQHPDVTIIQNDNPGILPDEIKEAVEMKQKDSKRTFSFVDDALKNAMLPIIVQ